MPADPATCNANCQSIREISQGKAIVPRAAPRFPDPFMNPPTIAGPRRVISMMVAQNAGAGTTCRPAAKAKRTAEAVLFRIAGAIIQSNPETVIETKGTIRRPQGLPQFLTEASQRMPPNNAPTAPATYVNEVSAAE